MKELKITQGPVRRAQKVVLYGSEGIGKSTLAAQFPDPLFIDTEGGTSHLDVRRISFDGSFGDLIETIEAVAAQDVCRSLVLDTMDWAEQICVADLLKKYRQTSIESFGYGKGYTYLAEEVQQILRAMDKVIASGKNAVIVAHAKYQTTASTIGKSAHALQPTLHFAAFHLLFFVILSGFTNIFLNVHPHLVLLL